MSNTYARFKSVGLFSFTIGMKTISSFESNVFIKISQKNTIQFCLVLKSFTLNEVILFLINELKVKNYVLQDYL